jgi:hypothetical protein
MMLRAYIKYFKGLLCLNQKILRFAWIICSMQPLLYSCDSGQDLEGLREEIFIRIYGGRGTEIGKDMKVLPDGGFVLMGTTTSFSESQDIYIVRTDPIGNPLWQKNYDYNNAGLDESGESMEVDADGNIVVCGWVEMDSETGNRDVLVLKTDGEGNLLQSRTFGDLEGVIQDESGSHIVHTQGDGGYFVTATHYESSTPNSWFYLIRLDGELNENEPYSSIMQRYYGGHAGHANIASSATSVGSIDNLFYVFGTTSATGANREDPNVPAGTNFYVYRWVADTDPQAGEHFFGSNENDYGITFTQGLTDRYFVLGGYQQNILGGVKKAYLMLISNRGTNEHPNFRREWSWVDEVYATNINTRTQIESAVQVRDGTVVALMTIENFQQIQAGDHFGLVKISGGAGSDGDVVWSTTFGSNEDDQAASVIELADGGLAVLGTIGYPINTSDIPSESKMVLYKLSANGRLESE